MQSGSSGYVAILGQRASRTWSSSFLEVGHITHSLHLDRLQSLPYNLEQ
jgi:hypothetical protein